jgi:hypothetical protein
MSERTDSEFARDIEEAIKRISSYTAGLTYEAFLLDTKIISNDLPKVMDPLTRLLDKEALE